MGEAKRKKDARGRSLAQRRNRNSVCRRVREATVGFGVLIPDSGSLVIVGSGVIVDPRGVVLTAKHVLEGLQKTEEKMKKDQPQAIARVMIPGKAQLQTDMDSSPSITLEMTLGPLGQHIGHAHHDLAVVRLPKPPRQLPSIDVDYGYAPIEGDPVATCGFPYGLEVHEGKSTLASFLWGWVSAVVPHPDMAPDHRVHYLLQLPTNPGNSGGAVFDPDTGKILGIASRHFAPKGMATALSIAEPVHHARQGIEAILAEV